MQPQVPLVFRLGPRASLRMTILGGILRRGGWRLFWRISTTGMRAQVHCGDPSQVGRVAIYSRNREDVTASFPELEEAFAAAMDPSVDEPGALIAGLMGRFLGWDFGDVVKMVRGRCHVCGAGAEDRSRKRVSNEWRARVPVVFMAFVTGSGCMRMGSCCCWICRCRRGGIVWRRWWWRVWWRWWCRRWWWMSGLAAGRRCCLRGRRAMRWSGR